MACAAPESLLVPVDFSDASAAGLQVAGALAARFGARLTVFHAEIATALMADVLAAGEVIADPGQVARDHHRSLEGQVRAFVQRVLGDGDDVPVAVGEAVFVAEAIVRAAGEHRADWICMGARTQRGLVRLVPGSTTAEVVRHSHVPVLTLRPPADGEGEFVFDDFRRVLVAVDLGPETGQLIEFGSLLAGPDGKLTILHVIEGLTERGLYGPPLALPAEDVKAAIEWTETALARATAGVREDLLEPFRVRIGRPGASILDVASDLAPDVTVLGTHGRHGADRWTLGSVAERVVRHAEGPVLVVPTGKAGGAAGAANG